MFLHPLLATKLPSAASISIGRAATSSDAGIDTAFTIAFTGAAPAAGTWIVFVADDTSGGGVPSGGTNAWTPIDASGVNQRCYVHLAAVGEPTSYSVSYSGASKVDNSNCGMFEIIGANGTNPDDHQVATSTLTPAAATSSAASDVSVICTAGPSSSSITAPPSGYTSQLSNSTTGTQVTIATKLTAGSGSIAPGACSGSTTGLRIWHLLFKV